MHCSAQWLRSNYFLLLLHLNLERKSSSGQAGGILCEMSQPFRPSLMKLNNSARHLQSQGHTMANPKLTVLEQWLERLLRKTSGSGIQMEDVN